VKANIHSASTECHSVKANIYSVSTECHSVKANVYSVFTELKDFGSAEVGLQDLALPPWSLDPGRYYFDPGVTAWIA
jgi:hypothetical protein